MRFFMLKVVLLIGAQNISSKKAETISAVEAARRAPRAS